MKYSEQFKTTIIQYVKNHPECSRRSIGKKFKVPPTLIRYWMDPEHQKDCIQKVRHKMLTNPKYRKNVNKATKNWIKEKKKTDPVFKAKMDKAVNDNIKYKLATDKNYKKRYKKLIQESNRKRRAKKQSINEHYTEEDKQYTLKLFNHQCAYCKSKENLCIDHWYPLSKGYALTRQNAVVLCNECNVRKNNKLPSEYFSKEFVDLIELTYLSK